MRYEEIDDIILIRLPREVNVAETTEFSNLCEFFLQKGFSKFVIDFFEVKFISSAFLSVLVAMKKRLFLSTGNVVLVNLSPSVYKILEITDLLSFFDIFSSQEEGIDYFNRVI
ncbi:MAG: STAS domain-containing protein [Brevinematia bacterium]